ncbi:hypothetical protein LK459_14390 [Gordonia otitidis]|uniref:alpha/beta hydrolase n=1 Tax=Gordonia otitidis TaxID=249058 RepID=UPI001D13505E|nr:hypothetical protein [Gordonia otitidis]UEA57799.1 hypothetical protein LK459_14390 [Gordonia otitidis]
MRIVNTPTYLRADTSPVFGVYTYPADGLVRGAVLICPPLGKELNHTWRGFKRLAESLAEQRLMVLRIDYAGTGESAGAQADPSAIDRWDESVTAAFDHLSGLGVGSIAVVAHRSGALVATANERVRDHAHALVLWDPVLRGRHFIRTQQMLYATLSEGDETSVSDRADVVHLAGLTLHKDAARAFSRMTLDPTAAVGSRTTGVLALVPEDELDSTLAHTVSDAGGTVQSISDQSPFILATEALLIDFPVELRRIAQWLPRHMPTATTKITPKPIERAVMAWTTDGRPIETQVRTTDDGIVVWDTALSGTHGTAERVLVTHPIGHDIRSGPARLYLELAHEVAARGGRAVRFDRRGVGESGTTSENDTFVKLFTSSYIRDGVRILDELNLTRITVLAHLGICAGNWMSAHAAIETARRQNERSRTVAIIANVNRWDVWPSTPVPFIRGAESTAARLEFQRHRTIHRGIRDTTDFVGRVRSPLLRAAMARLRVFQVPETMIAHIQRSGADVRLILAPNDYRQFERLGGPRAFTRRGISVPIAQGIGTDHSGYHLPTRNLLKQNALRALGLDDVVVSAIDGPDPQREPLQPVQTAVR